MPFYRFSSTSSAVDDGYNVIAPNVGTGRWLLLRENVSVATVLQLLEIPPSQRSPDLPIYVTATNSWYSFKAAAPTLPGELAPIVGSGSWGVNSQIAEVVPPYQRVNNFTDATARADLITSIDIGSLISNSPYKDATARADLITSISLVSDSAYREATARADLITSILLIDVSPYRDATARAEQITSSTIAAGAIPWLDLTAADWLNMTAADWLDQTI